MAHSLALGKKNDGKGGFHSVIESDREQISQCQSEVYHHLFSAPIEELLQRNDGHEAYWPKGTTPISNESRPERWHVRAKVLLSPQWRKWETQAIGRRTNNTFKSEGPK